MVFLLLKEKTEKPRKKDDRGMAIPLSILFGELSLLSD